MADDALVVVAQFNYNVCNKVLLVFELLIMYCNTIFLDSCEAETKSFLACKEEWKREIEEKLEKMKIMERELSNKEKELLEVRGGDRENGREWGNRVKGKEIHSLVVIP